MLAVSADTGEVITAQVLEPIDEVVEEEGETVVEVREAPPGSARFFHWFCRILEID